MTFTWKKTGRCIALYGVIYPFLFVVGIIDFIIGLIIPYKYEDNELPDKDAVLSKITDPTDKSSAFRSTLFPDLIRIEDRDTNLYKEFCECVKSYFDFQTMGVREILSIDDEKQPNGKVFKKYSLGNYKWMKYEDLLTKIDNFSNGLLNIGLKSDMSVVIFAETRPEWLTSAFSCFRIKAPLVTLYSTLGVDALAYGINQTNSSYMITSGEQLPKIQKILNKIPNLTHLIVLNDKFTEKNFNDFKKNATNLTVYKMDELVEIGKNSDKKISFVSPKKDDLAVIMYTSGSTGNLTIKNCLI
jgi:long-chain acyl-CoA synthetase